MGPFSGVPLFGCLLEKQDAYSYLLDVLSSGNFKLALLRLLFVAVETCITKRPLSSTFAVFRVLKTGLRK
jgi:hypothetical protein